MVLPIIAAGAAGVMAAKGLYDIYSQNKSDQRARQAMREQLARMQHAATVYEGYRPQMAGARRAAYEASVQPYQGANNALTTMYGASNAQSTTPQTGMTFGPPRPEGVPFGQASQDELARGKATLEANGGQLASLAGDTYGDYASPEEAAQARMASQKANRAKATKAQTSNSMAMRRKAA